MTALKRIVAYVIDYAILFIPSIYALDVLLPISLRTHASKFMPFWSFSSLGISLVLPAVLLGIMTGLTGRTPGKLLMFLRVQDYADDPPGIGPGILREVIKAVSLAFVFGMIYALQAVVNKRPAFYDEWLNLEVEDLAPYGLTETQKNYRKFMREKQRRERRR